MTTKSNCFLLGTEISLPPPFLGIKAHEYIRHFLSSAVNEARQIQIKTVVPIFNDNPTTAIVIIGIDM